MSAKGFGTILAKLNIVCSTLFVRFAVPGRFSPIWTMIFIALSCGKSCTSR